MRWECSLYSIAYSGAAEDSYRGKYTRTRGAPSKDLLDNETRELFVLDLSCERSVARCRGRVLCIFFMPCKTSVSRCGRKVRKLESKSFIAVFGLCVLDGRRTAWIGMYGGGVLVFDGVPF